MNALLPRVMGISGALQLSLLLSLPAQISSLYAEPPPNKAANPGRAIGAVDLAELALERAESMGIGELMLEDARIAGEYAGTWRNPSVSLEGGRRRTTGGAFPGSLTGGGANRVFRFTVSQPLYFPGKTGLRAEAAEIHRRLAALSLTETSLILRYQVIRLAYATAAAERVIAHVESRVKRFRLIEAYLRGRPALSPARRAEREIVRRRLRMLERGLHELEVSRTVLLSRLALYTGDGVSARVAWIRDAGRPLDQEKVQSLALERSPGLLKEKLRVAYAAAEERLAARESYPDLEIFGTVEQEPGAERYFGVGLRMALPIFDRNRAAVSRGKLRSRAAALRLELERKQVRQAIQAAFAEFEHSREALRIFPLTLEKRTLQEMAAADAGFRRGRLELLTYLEADELAFETLRAIYDTQLDYITYYTELQMLAGDPRFADGSSPAAWRTDPGSAKTTPEVSS
ncbi:MAG: TolC family protein [Leptospirales bacterium]|jgi:outer membrane protein TolC